MSEHLASARTLSLLATVRAGTAATTHHPTATPSEPSRRQPSLERTQRAVRSLRPTEAG